jgi:23S rRNA-/tRNA-specific pseudouridylate synthase
METMTAFDWLWELNNSCGGFWSTERQKTKVSNSEMRRWITNGSIRFNGNVCKPNDEVEHIRSIVLFPKSDKKRTSFLFNEE